jgi:hypothetical protein
MIQMKLAVTLQLTVTRALHSIRTRMAESQNERGEGVISAAIAVLIMAVIGAAMFVAYKKIFDDSSKSVGRTVTSIGNAPTT